LWVTHKVSDHHLHNEWQWLAATTPHWLHQFLIVGVVCNNLIKTSGRKPNNYLCPEFLLHFLKQW
jgi:hypothetical protein